MWELKDMIKYKSETPIGGAGGQRDLIKSRCFGALHDNHCLHSDLNVSNQTYLK